MSNDPLPPKPTMRQLASYLGLGLSTVSLALRDKACISKSTRERVQKAALEMGYVRDPRVSKMMGYLKKQRHDKPKAAIAYIFNHPKNIKLKEDFKIFHNYYLGARAQATFLGYKLQEFNLTQENLSSQRLTSILKARGIEGIIIPPLITSNEAFNIDISEFASITLGYSFKAPKINRITLDHFNSTMMILDLAVARGYKRIGMIMRPNDERFEYRWISAKEGFHLKHPKQDRIPILRTNEPRNEIVEWFQAHKPDLIIAESIDWAAQLKTAGYRCKRDFDFIHVAWEAHETERERLKDPELEKDFESIAGLYQNSYHIGELAINLLEQNLSLNLTNIPQTPSLTLVDGEWREGTTIRPGPCVK